MKKKFTSPLTSTLTPDNWKDKINLQDMSLDEMVNLMGDARTMQKLGKLLDGFMKEAVMARMPEGEDEYATDYWEIYVEEKERAGGLNRDKILEEMGEDWVFDHTKDPTEYFQVSCKAVVKE